METTKTGFDPTALSRLAYKRIGRRGLRVGLEAEELVSTGRAAIIAARVTDAPLAVKVAQNAMFDSIRKTIVRERGRVRVRHGDSYCCEGEQPSVGDMWDSTVHHGQHLRPAAEHYDVWEAMKALPPRQYRAIVLTFWNGMSDEGVAIEMGISSQAVDSLLRKAKINLKQGVGMRTVQTLTHVRGEESRRAVLSSRTGATQ